jgi:hypothetical protein
MELSLACILQRTHARANGHGLVDLNIRRTAFSESWTIQP